MRPRLLLHHLLVLPVQLFDHLLNEDLSGYVQRLNICVALLLLQSQLSIGCIVVSLFLLEKVLHRFFVSFLIISHLAEPITVYKPPSIIKFFSLIGLFPLAIYEITIVIIFHR